MLHTCILGFGAATWFSSDAHENDLVLGVTLPESGNWRFNAPIPSRDQLVSRTTLTFRPSAAWTTRLFLYNQANHCVAELRARPDGPHRFLITLEGRDWSATTPLRENDPEWWTRHVLVVRVKSLSGRAEPLSVGPAV